MMRCLPILAIVLLLQIEDSAAFVTNNNRALSLSASSSSTAAFMAKKKKKTQAGKGFGKELEKVQKPAPSQSSNSDLFNIDARVAQQQSSAFTSVDGGSNAIPTMSATTTKRPENIEDRTGEILREKYGLRTREEQEAAEAKKKQMQEQRQKLNEWNRLADEGEDFDLLEIIPDPVLIFIDKFLKVGVTVSTILFVLAGIAITIEAGSKATENPLPPEVDAFVANVVEPYFTPGLGVLLSFSVGLGLFASLQLNSAASTYREDK